MTAPFGAIPQPKPATPKPPATATPKPITPPPAPAPSPVAPPPAPAAPAAAPAAPTPQVGAIPQWQGAPSPTPPPAPGPSTAPGASAPTAPYAANAQYQAATALQSAGAAPDRVELAKQALAQLTADTAPQFAADQRTIGQNAAKFGRIGSGMTTNELTESGLARQRTLDSEAARLATTAAGQTLDDRLALTREALNQYSTFQGADANQRALDVQKELGLGNLDVSRGNLDLGRNELGERERAAKASEGIQQLQGDRNFFLDDRTAEAMAALGGTDFSTGGITPAFTPAAATAAPGGYTMGPNGLVPITGAPMIAPPVAEDPRILEALAAMKGAA